VAFNLSDSVVPFHGNAKGWFWEMENNAKIPLLRTAAENISIQNVS
jgi:hypothetical protein